MLGVDFIFGAVGKQARVMALLRQQFSRLLCDYITSRIEEMGKEQVDKRRSKETSFALHVSF